MLIATVQLALDNHRYHNWVTEKFSAVRKGLMFFYERVILFGTAQLFAHHKPTFEKPYLLPLEFFYDLCCFVIVLFICDQRSQLRLIPFWECLVMLFNKPNVVDTVLGHTYRAPDYIDAY